jgi:hypothetical protein
MVIPMTGTTYMVRHLNVVSVAKIGAAVGFIFGLIEGIIIGTIAGAAGTAIPGMHPFLGLGLFGVIVFFAIVVGLIGGFISAAIWALVYNGAAGILGPVEIDLETKP